MAGDLTSKASEDDQELQDKSASLGASGLIVKLQDGYKGRCVDEAIEILNGEEHGNTVDH